MRERNIQSQVVGYARKKGVIARKLDFGQGWPDYMFLYRKRIMFLEFKSDTGRLRELQKIIIGQLDHEGFDVGVVRDIDHGCTLVDLLVNSV